MLKVLIHSGLLEARNQNNILVSLDIGYRVKAPLADYGIAAFIKGVGEVEPDEVSRYPRWSGSLWDLVARALTRIVYRADQAPEAKPADRRCAYATRMCACILRYTLSGEAEELATAAIAQGDRRGFYTVHLDEDILGKHSATFSYGEKTLRHADLVLRAICWALYGRSDLAPRPKLLVPTPITLDGVERFDTQSLQEPARTGFNRFRCPMGSATPPDPMPKADDYVRFLMKG